MISLVGELGRFTLDRIAGLGRIFMFLCSAFGWAFRPPIRIRLIVEHIGNFGMNSLSVVFLSGVFTGMVGGPQGYYSLRQFNAENYIGSALRELGPVLSAFVVTGRTGSAIAAEIASMKVTEQIDALYSMAINPIQYLVSPRIIAGLISMPLLTSIFNIAGIYGWIPYSRGVAGCQLGSLLRRDGAECYFPRRVCRFSQIREFWADHHLDLLLQRISGAAYGGRSGSSHYTETVVMCFVLIVVWDYFMTSVML